MGVFGFGNVGGAVGEDPTAGHPSRGLVALYKGDEYEGSSLEDATGNMPPIALSTGVALDCTANAQYFTDTTSFSTDATTGLNGQPVELAIGLELWTGAETGANNYDYITSNSASGDCPVEIALREATYGTGYIRWRIYVNVQASKDGAGAAQASFVLPTTFYGLKSSTHYYIAIVLRTGTSTPYYTAAIRSSKSDPWIYGTGTTAETAAATGYVFSTTVATQVLSTQSAASPFTGKIISAFISQGVYDLADIQALVMRPTQTAIAATLGARSRYWDFRGGYGHSTKVIERVTGTLEELTGTETWARGLTGCSQTATRQGMAYYGKAGIRLGGETSFTAPGFGGVSAATVAPCIASPDGWTVLATFRVGPRDPAAEQLLCGFVGPDATDAYDTDITKLAGVFFTLGTDQVVKVRAKRMIATGTDNGTNSVADIGAGGNYASNGLLTTYAISCSSAGVITLRRVAIGDSSVTTVTPSITTNAGFVSTRANAAKFGWASFDADFVGGFLANHNVPLTDAEVMQAHRCAVARMRGQDIYVNGVTGLLGNGTENAPYSTLHTAWRVMQPGQTVRVTGGTHARKTNLGVVSSPAIPSSSDHITIIGTGTPTFVSTGTTSESHPLELVSGHWTWSGFRSNAADAADNIAPTIEMPTPPPGYANAVNASEDVDYVSFSDCAFDNAAKSEESNGTGFACRAKTVRVIDCTADGNEEHGVYLRRWVGETEDGAVTVDGLTCTIPAGGEDGLKITAEGAGGRLWRGSIRNLTVTGGKNQLNLKGFVGDLANVLLKDQESEQELLAACYLGSDPAYTGETLDSDYRFEGRVTNMTIVGANARAVWVKGSNTTAELYNVLIKDTAGVDLEVDEDSPCTTSHCAGDAATGEWPDENGNIPGATITFVGATYVLDPASDGYGDGVNMTGIIEEAELNLAGDARPTTGAWNIGAY